MPASALQFTFEIETALIVTTEFQYGSETEAYTRAIESRITNIELFIPKSVTRSGTNNNTDVAHLSLDALRSQQGKDSKHTKNCSFHFVEFLFILVFEGSGL